MDSDLMELFGMLMHLILMYLEYCKLHSRRWWVRPININRDILGHFSITYMRMKETDPELFFANTRMTAATYNLLLNLIHEDLTKKSIRPSIDAECRLAITLSYLSQGVSFKYLSWGFHIGKSTIRSIIMETCEIIWQALSPVYVSQSNITDFEDSARLFNERWNMPHCIGAIDGKHNQIQAPSSSGAQFFNYKKFHSIVLMAVCDSQYVFTHVSVGTFGSQSDGGIFKATTFGRKLLAGELTQPREDFLPNSTTRFPYYFVGDAAFPLREELMRPYPGKSLPRDKEIFNYRLSRARRIIENSFGILVARWRVLKNTITLQPHHAEKVVLSTIALHNFIIINDEQRKYAPSTFSNWENATHEVVHGQWRNDEELLVSVRLGANNAARHAFNLRDYFMNEGLFPFRKQLQQFLFGTKK